MRRLLRDYSLSIVLLTLFLLAWVAQTITGWYDFKAEQQTLGEPATAFGSGGYLWSWSEATFENWQSEFLQLFAFVVLTSFLIHRGSHESKDSDEKLQASVDRIERRLNALSPTPPEPPANGRSEPSGVANPTRGGVR
jgi:hypothetical protein